MRKHIQSNTTAGYKIIAVDDDSGVLDSLSVLLNRNGYNFVGITDPIQAIERVKKRTFWFNAIRLYDDTYSWR